MKYRDKNSCNVLLEVKWYFRKGIAPLVSAYTVSEDEYGPIGSV